MKDLLSAIQAAHVLGVKVPVTVKTSVGSISDKEKAEKAFSETKDWLRQLPKDAIYPQVEEIFKDPFMFFLRGDRTKGLSYRTPLNELLHEDKVQSLENERLVRDRNEGIAKGSPRQFNKYSDSKEYGMNSLLRTRKDYGTQEAAMLKEIQPPEVLSDYDEQGENPVSAPVIEERAEPDGNILVIDPTTGGVPVAHISETPNKSPKTIVVPEEGVDQSIEDAQKPVILVVNGDNLEGLDDEDVDDEEGPGAPLECPGCGCTSKLRDQAITAADNISCPECGTKVATVTIVKTAGVYKVATREPRICIAHRIRKMAAALEGRAPLSGIPTMTLNVKVYDRLDELAASKPPYIGQQIKQLKALINNMVHTPMSPSEETERKLELHNKAQKLDPIAFRIVNDLFAQAQERNLQMGARKVFKGEPTVKQGPAKTTEQRMQELRELVKKHEGLKAPV